MSTHGSGCHGHDHGHGAAAGADADVAECPVMPGSLTVKSQAEAAGLVRDYNGVRYYLCCAGCGPKFDANPAQYATAH